MRKSNILTQSFPFCSRYLKLHATRSRSVRPGAARSATSGRETTKAESIKAQADDSAREPKKKLGKPGSARRGAELRFGAGVAKRPLSAGVAGWAHVSFPQRKQAGIRSCRRRSRGKGGAAEGGTTHSPERKERKTPMKPSAPFMSERGAFAPTGDHVS